MTLAQFPKFDNFENLFFHAKLPEKPENREPKLLKAGNGLEPRTDLKNTKD